jgi:hypothetical protein
MCGDARLPECVRRAQSPSTTHTMRALHLCTCAVHRSDGMWERGNCYCEDWNVYFGPVHRLAHLPRPWWIATDFGSC